MVDGRDLVVGGLDPRDVRVHRGLQLGFVATGGHERDVVVTQVLTHQPAGVAGSAVHNNRLAHYIPIPPSTGRPMPVMNRASSEARKTTASAMSVTSPSRPAGV